MLCSDCGPPKPGPTFFSGCSCWTKWSIDSLIDYGLYIQHILTHYYTFLDIIGMYWTNLYLKFLLYKHINTINWTWVYAATGVTVSPKTAQKCKKLLATCLNMWENRTKSRSGFQKGYCHGQINIQTFGSGVLLQENIVTGCGPRPHLAYSVMVGEARWAGVGWGAQMMMQGPQRWTELMEITDIYSFRAWSQMFVCRMSPPPLLVCQVVVVVVVLRRCRYFILEADMAKTPANTL